MPLLDYTPKKRKVKLNSQFSRTDSCGRTRIRCSVLGDLQGYILWKRAGFVNNKSLKRIMNEECGGMRFFTTKPPRHKERHEEEKMVGWWGEWGDGGKCGMRNAEKELLESCAQNGLHGLYGRGVWPALQAAWPVAFFAFCLPPSLVTTLPRRWFVNWEATQKVPGRQARCVHGRHC